MRGLKIFYLRVCFTLFMSEQLSNAEKTEISDPNKIFKYIVKIDSFLVKEPNQNHFAEKYLAKQMFLGIHNEWNTFSFYESGAPNTLFTFKQRQVDFENFHSTSMSFHVRDNKDVYHFRIVFSARKSSMETLYSYFGINTGTGHPSFKIHIMKVESYVKTDQMQDAIIQTVEDLEPATISDQIVEGGRYSSIKKMYRITPYSTVFAKRKPPRLVFRTGASLAALVDDKIVIGLSGFEDCFYILYLENLADAQALRFSINGPNEGVALEIPADLRSYLEGASQSDDDDPRTLQLAHWGGNHSRDGRGSSRNVRARSHEDRD